MPRRDASSRSNTVLTRSVHCQQTEQVPFTNFFDNSIARSINLHTEDSHQSMSDVAHLTSSSHNANNHPLTNGLTLDTPFDTTWEHSSLLQNVRRRILKELETEKEAQNHTWRQKKPSKLNLHRQRALKITFGTDSGVVSTSCGERGMVVRENNKHLSGCHTNNHDELIVSSVEFSLFCPYSKLPIRCPVRSYDCCHLQCCELESWLVLMGKYRSLRDPKAPCPVCQKRVSASSLEVDFWMQDVLEQMPADTHLVVLNIDGNCRSGDESREKRKEGMITDVIDTTQGDYNDNLNEVIDDNSDDDHCRNSCGQVEFNPVSVSRMIHKRDRAASPFTSIDPLAHSSPNAAVFSQGPQAIPALVNSAVKTEFPLASTEILSATTIRQAPGISQDSSDDNGVVVVRCIQGRTLPSQLRLWVTHCMHCGNSFSMCQSDHTEMCSHCGHCTKEHQTLVRRFPENPVVTMELIPDGTLILCGVDAIAAYLYRAGFQRYLEPQELFMIVKTSSPASLPTSQKTTRSVWASGIPFTRLDLDFLEACCERVANGEGLEEVRDMMVPRLFRIPRRRHSALGFITHQTRVE
ncbi:unnamed protein product [Phytomonas sp. Hart1]|nr:unnamed protein product [Phytomonas sp. Hart1]|eukprot:CCW68397.1 unnamed protein product [Phytomonas sp. isolate Hart1]